MTYVPVHQKPDSRRKMKTQARPLTSILSHFLVSTIPQDKRNSVGLFVSCHHPPAAPGQRASAPSFPSPWEKLSCSAMPSSPREDTKNLESPLCFNKTWLTGLY